MRLEVGPDAGFKRLNSSSSHSNVPHDGPVPQLIFFLERNYYLHLPVDEEKSPNLWHFSTQAVLFIKEQDVLSKRSRTPNSSYELSQIPRK